MLIYGAGGHAKVMLSILRENGIPVEGIFDDYISGEIQGTPILGIYKKDAFPNTSIVIAIGDNVQRRRVAAMVHHRFEKVVHSSAWIDPSTTIKGGCMISHRVVVQADVCLGKHVILNTGCIVEHDCMVEDCVHIAPGAILCGQVKIGENTLVGAGCIICPGVCIGKNCLVAAGSIVTKNISDGSVVRGNPARVIKCIA